MNKANVCTGSQVPYAQSIGIVDHPIRRSSSSQGSAPKKVRSQSASSRSSQNGLTFGTAHLRGRKTLAPMATSSVLDATTGRVTAVGPSPIARRTPIAEARPIKAQTRYDTRCGAGAIPKLQAAAHKANSMPVTAAIVRSQSRSSPSKTMRFFCQVSHGHCLMTLKITEPPIGDEHDLQHFGQRCHASSAQGDVSARGGH